MESVKGCRHQVSRYKLMMCNVWAIRLWRLVLVTRGGNTAKGLTLRYTYDRQQLVSTQDAQLLFVFSWSWGDNIWYSALHARLSWNNHEYVSGFIFKNHMSLSCIRAVCRCYRTGVVSEWIELRYLKWAFGCICFHWLNGLIICFLQQIDTDWSAHKHVANSISSIVVIKPKCASNHIFQEHSGMRTRALIMFASTTKNAVSYWISCWWHVRI